uniref:Myosin-binding domain-containing protein n=1 Tax=Kalmanozyma brasiliensis (strain GHG001) TaxID=1365824 RepID=V5EXJ2_KALBG
MAEAVIFGGSPLDQYLRDADQTEEQALVNDAASVVETQEPVYTERQPIDVSNASFIEKFNSLDDTLEFVVSRQAGHSAAASTKSLRKLSTTLEYSSAEKKALQRAVLPDVSRLIKAAQSFDVSINKAISAIQEVEIVSRGYKLTHPLPPISRIEAASSSSRVDSPTRSRRSLIPSAPSANAKLGRSLSGGGHGAPTVRRHAYRPLSLNLSNGRFSPLDRPSGRVSPAVSSEVGDLDLTQKMLVEQSTAALATGRQAPQRLVELRKGIVDALEQPRRTEQTLMLNKLGSIAKH